MLIMLIKIDDEQHRHFLRGGQSKEADVLDRVQAGGLEGVVAAETVLSDVDGLAGRLVLRGHSLEAIAGRRSFEWMVGVLWEDFVAGDLREASLRRALGAMRAEVFAGIDRLLSATAGLAPIEALRVLVAAVPDDAPGLPLRLVATVAVGLASVLRRAEGKVPVAPDPALGHAADFLRMLRGAAPSA